MKDEKISEREQIPTPSPRPGPVHVPSSQRVLERSLLFPVRTQFCFSFKAMDASDFQICV